MYQSLYVLHFTLFNSHNNPSELGTNMENQTLTNQANVSQMCKHDNLNISPNTFQAYF